MTAPVHDFAAVIARPMYGTRDEFIGTRSEMVAGPFATQEEAWAALAQTIELDAGGEPVDDELVRYVGRVSDGLRRLPAPAATDSYADEIPF